MAKMEMQLDQNLSKIVGRDCIGPAAPWTGGTRTPAGPSLGLICSQRKKGRIEVAVVQHY
jgi:hypothetical protein